MPLSIDVVLVTFKDNLLPVAKLALTSWSCKIHCACANTILRAQYNPVQEVWVISQFSFVTLMQVYLITIYYSGAAWNSKTTIAKAN